MAKISKIKNLLNLHAKIFDYEKRKCKYFRGIAACDGGM